MPKRRAGGERVTRRRRAEGIQRRRDTGAEGAQRTGRRGPQPQLPSSAKGSGSPRLDEMKCRGHRRSYGDTTTQPSTCCLDGLCRPHQLQRRPGKTELRAVILSRTERNSALNSIPSKDTF